MANLPEWLWPSEDEEAIQEAERLIENTQDILQRMEADMGTQRTFGQHIMEKTEKLKTAIYSRMQVLENELKIISNPTSSTSLSDQSKSLYKPHQCKTHSKNKSNHQPTQIFHGSHSSVPQHLKSHSIKINPSSEDAEKVVLTARAKVQDALAVARNVSASLEQRVSASSSIHNKPVTRRHHRNVGVFEVKSIAEETKVKAPKFRLQQALLPTISIKRCLELQSIPSIQVPPSEKFQPLNVSVCNMKHKDEDSTYDNCKKQSPSCKATGSPLQSKETETAISQLSKQLAEVEELREINQTQVNQVLRFLLSRVCTPSPPKRLNNQQTSHNDTVDNGRERSSPKSNTTSTSENSKYSIAYDSLSRFLETYKRAAEQTKLVKKSVSARKQRVALKQRKDIERMESASKNHLLIGPLRHSSRDKESGGSASDLQEFVNSSPSGSLNGLVNILGSHVSSSGSILKDSTEEDNTPSEKTENNPNILQESSKSSVLDSLELLPLKTFGAVSGEEYEDDWEEEENVDGKTLPDENNGDVNLTEHALQTISEIEVHFSPSLPVASLNLSLHAPASESLQVQRRSLNSPSSKLSAFENARSCPEDLRTLALEEKVGSTKNSFETLSGEVIPLQAVNELKNEDHSNLVIEKENDIVNSPKEQRDEAVSAASPVVKEIGCKSVAVNTSPCRRVAAKHQSILTRNRDRNLNSCSSSSDAESNCGPRHPIHKPRRWDLSLKEDLQLQSAILLNWQLEDHWKTKIHGGVPVSDQISPQATAGRHGEAIEDVEKRWQKTLDQLDQRMKTIEDHERIHCVVNEIIRQSRENCSKPSYIEAKIDINEVDDRSANDKPPNATVKVLTKEQTVQTHPGEETRYLTQEKQFKVLSSATSREHFDSLPSAHFNSNVLQKNGFAGIRTGQFRPTSFCSEDLTSELLAYSRMGILPKSRFQEQSYSKSLSLSTTSSQLQQSSTVVSFSDGEMQGSLSSCSCSEGEICMCGGLKRSYERAPPDGSQTFSDGENFLRNVSLGEILPTKAETSFKDSSFGEIASSHMATGESSPSGPDLVEEESFESDGLEWDLKCNSSLA